MQQLLQQQRQQEAEQQQQQLPSLQQLCVGVLGRHVTELVQQLDGQLAWLPADVKAALLAVARCAQLQQVIDVQRFGAPVCACCGAIS
jgi:hypothetical protein